MKLLYLVELTIWNESFTVGVDNSLRSPNSIKGLESISGILLIGFRDVSEDDDAKSTQESHHFKLLIPSLMKR